MTATAPQTGGTSDRSSHRLVEWAARQWRSGARWWFPIAVWATSRAFFLVVGLCGAHLIRRAVPAGFPLEPAGALNYWAHWDGGWYTAIATQGYERTVWPSSAAFFPVYPMLVRAGTWIGGGPAAWGVAISLAASLGAIFFVHDLGTTLLRPAAARAATVSFAFFPTALFMNAVYSESVFLAASAGAVWAALVRRNLVLAGLFGCVASGTRSIGFFLVVPLFCEWLRRRREHGRGGLLAIALVPWGVAAYMFWLWRWSTHPLLFSSVIQSGWGRRWQDPVTTVSHAWEVARSGAGWAVRPDRVVATQSGNPAFGAMEAFNFVFLLVLAALLVLAVKRLPAELTAYSALVAVFPLLTPASFSPLASIPRYMLAAFPLFLSLGTALARNRLLYVTWLTLAVATGALFTLYFTSWRWVA